MAKKRGYFQYFGLFGAQTGPYDSKENGIGIYIEKLTEAHGVGYQLKEE